MLASGVAGATASAETSDDVTTIPKTPEEIRTAFADVPRLDDPEPRERRNANSWYPEVVVPDTGPVPDPDAGTMRHEMTAPRWVLASVYDSLRPGADRSCAIDYLLSTYDLHQVYMTPDGRRAPDVIAEAVNHD